MRKKLLAILLVLCMTLCLLPTAALAEEKSPFNDVEGHWAEDSIDRWADYGVLNGKDESTFDPDGKMTRAEFATMLVNLMGYTETSDQTFTDMTGHWGADAISKLVKAGVMNGMGDGTMDPDGQMTREMAAVMLCRAFNLKPSKDASLSFSDSANVSSWAKDAMAALSERGMINGVGNNLLSPEGIVDRATAAKLADNMIVEYVTEDNATITGEVKGIVIVKANNVKVEDATLSAPLVVAPAAAKATVTLTGTTKAEGVVVAAENAKVVVDKNASAETVTVTAPKAETQVAGKVESVAVTESAEGAKATVAKGAEVKTVTVEAPQAKAEVAGKVESVAVAETAKDVTVNTSSGAEIGNVTTEAEGTKVAGSGKVDTVTATGNADKVSVSTDGTKTENKTENGSMTDGKGNETKPGETGTAKPSTPSTGGTTTTTPENPDPNPGGDEDPKDPTVEKPSTGDADNREEEKGTAGTKTEVTDPTADEIAAAATKAEVGECTHAANKTHTWVKDTEAAGNKAPTCTQEGVAVYKCSNATDSDTCTATVTVAVKKLGHTTAENGKVVITKQPTCTEAGSKDIKCANCEMVLETEAITAKGHDFENSTRYGTDDAQHWKICKYCDTADTTKTNHSWTKDTSKSTEATCLVKGTTVSNCACGAKKTEEVAKKDHAAATAGDGAKWVTDANKHWKVCATPTCTAKVDEADHSYDKQNPTGKCKVCERACPVDHATILTTAKCPTCGAAGTKTPEATKYTITIAKTTNGTVGVSTSTNEVAAGTEVTVTATPNKGYQIKEGTLKVSTEGKDGDVTVTDNKFTMPEANVTVTAEFEAEPTATHTCEAASDATWQSNETHHWHNCKDADCPNKDDPTKLPDYEAHKDETTAPTEAGGEATAGADQKCDVCGKAMPGQGNTESGT